MNNDKCSDGGWERSKSKESDSTNTSTYGTDACNREKVIEFPIPHNFNNPDAGNAYLKNNSWNANESDHQVNKDVVDAKIAAAEARTDTKIEKVLGEMRLGFEDLRSHMNDTGNKLKLWFVFTSLGLLVGGATLLAAVLNAGRIVAWFAGTSTS